jgi:beta-glucosidase
MRICAHAWLKVRHSGHSGARFCAGVLLVCLARMLVLPANAAQAPAERPWNDRSLQPARRAELLLAAMTLDEKITMVHGGRGGYVGNVPANARLGIPALNLSDGPAGVGNRKTQVTAFPAPITVGAGFDVDLMRRYGEAMGAEQLGKGTNVHLAPMMNMIRVPQGGRTWEGYGEDPYHASRMAGAEIAGMQSVGVIATAKHFIGNEQENGRNIVSSDVDDRTLVEVYLAPFKASVAAGAGAIMCSYNKINSVYACENSMTQNFLMKGLLGFQGWIMSDWGATHSTAAAAINGLDQEMPGGNFFGDKLASAVKSGDVPQSRLDDMVRRMLTSMFRAGIFDRNQTGAVDANVQTPEHAQLAREAAAQGIVLLKNAGNILPFETTQIHSIAVIGAAASTNPIVAGGGSASVVIPYIITALQGITSRAGNGIKVSYAKGDDVAAAADLARQADASVVVVGLAASEGRDRPNLSLPAGQDALVSAIAQVNPRTVVITYVPAQILMPWIDQVPVVLVGWLPGQEGGNALASVLFGDVNPAGRLPVTFARNPEDYPANTPRQYPGVDNHVLYSEGLRIGYRHFDAKDIAPVFPFGHGLSYTTFRYSDLRVSPAGVTPQAKVQVSLSVANTGKRAGAEVVQLYLGFPSETSEPPKQLKGFQKILLQPGQTKQVSFTLAPEDYSFWSAGSRNWEIYPGNYQVMVGASSRDIRLTGNFTAKGGALAGTIYQAEAAKLGNGTRASTSQPGYTGAGFVDGFTAEGASVALEVKVTASARYDVTVRYANANDGRNAARKISIYVNGAKVGQTSLPALANGETWDFKTEALMLRAGTNEIAYKYDPGDDGGVCLDAIIVGFRGQALR